MICHIPHTSHLGFVAAFSLHLPQVCPNPVPQDCIAARGVTACMVDTFNKVDPDQQKLTPVMDEYQLYEAMTTPGTLGVIMIANITLTLASSPPPPPAAAAGGGNSGSGGAPAPPLLPDNFTIMSDPRGPRLFLDCGMLSDRVTLGRGASLRIYHLVLSNCTTFKPLSHVRMEPGANVVMNDTIIYPVSWGWERDGTGGEGARRTRLGQVGTQMGVGKGVGDGRQGEWDGDACGEMDFQIAVELRVCCHCKHLLQKGKLWEGIRCCNLMQSIAWCN